MPPHAERANARHHTLNQHNLPELDLPASLLRYGTPTSDQLRFHLPLRPHPRAAHVSNIKPSGIRKKRRLAPTLMAPNARAAARAALNAIPHHEMHGAGRGRGQPAAQDYSGNSYSNSQYPNTYAYGGLAPAPAQVSRGLQTEVPEYHGAYGRMMRDDAVAVKMEQQQRDEYSEFDRSMRSQEAQHTPPSSRNTMAQQPPANNLTSRIDQLEAKLEAALDRIASLEGDVQHLTNENTQLRQQNSAPQNSIAPEASQRLKRLGDRLRTLELYTYPTGHSVAD